MARNFDADMDPFGGYETPARSSSSSRSSSKSSAAATVSSPASQAPSKYSYSMDISALLDGSNASSESITPVMSVPSSPISGPSSGFGGGSSSGDGVSGFFSRPTNQTSKEEEKQDSEYDPLGFLGNMAGYAQATYDKAVEAFKAPPEDRSAVVNSVTDSYASALEKAAYESAMLVEEQRKAGFSTVPEKFRLNAAPEVATTELPPVPSVMPVFDTRDPMSGLREDDMDMNSAMERFGAGGVKMVGEEELPTVDTSVPAPAPVASGAGLMARPAASAFTIPEALYSSKAPGYRQSQVVGHSYYNDPLVEGSLRGNSRRGGDASKAVQKESMNAIIREGKAAGMSNEDIALTLAIARHESGFNPDAAAGTTSAHGLGQFVNKTGKSYGLTAGNRWDVNAQAKALVAHTKDNISKAEKQGKSRDYVYAYHHDGPSLKYGGLGIGKANVTPRVAGFLSMLEGGNLVVDTSELSSETTNQPLVAKPPTVKAIQRIIGTTPDGAFGPNSRKAAKAFLDDYNVDYSNATSDKELMNLVVSRPNGSLITEEDAAVVQKANTTKEVIDAVADAVPPKLFQNPIEYTLKNDLIGLDERNPLGQKAIRGFFSTASPSVGGSFDENDAWCAVFVDSVLRGIGAEPMDPTSGPKAIADSKQAPYGPMRALEYQNYGTGVDLKDAKAGDLIILSSSHIGFYTGEKDENGRYLVLGGNQSNAGSGSRGVSVNVSPYSANNIGYVRRIENIQDLPVDVMKEVTANITGNAKGTR